MQTPRALFALTTAVAAFAGACALFGYNVGDYREGDAAAPSDALTDGAPGDAGPCADGMVRISGTAISFCMDATEVTLKDFSTFLATKPDASKSAPCAFNTSIGQFATGRGPSSPVVQVNWCDADAYCRWAGKRLCGRIGGGTNALDASNDPAVSEWEFACSNGGQTPFPYAQAYDPQACNGLELGAGVPWDVGTHPRCQGPFPGLFDLSGNVTEWDNECDGKTGTSDRCFARGGSFQSGSDALGCVTPGGAAALRGDHNATRGFRCCAD